jgi:chitin disaccharide deacetylase
VNKTGKPCAKGVARELAAQLQRVCDYGLNPDHVDAHQHIYLFGLVAEALFPVLKQFGIRSVRNPQPAESPCTDPQGELGDELDVYRRFAPDFSVKCKIACLSTPEGLWGMSLLNQLTTASLLRTLNLIPAGYWELMVHPGNLDPQNPFGGRERIVERRALCHPKVVRRVQERAIKLISFGDLP